MLRFHIISKLPPFLQADLTPDAADDRADQSPWPSRVEGELGRHCSRTRSTGITNTEHIRRHAREYICHMLHVTCYMYSIYIYNTYWILYEQLHLFTMMKTRCGVKRGLWKCWFRLQNEIKTRWGDSKNEVGLKHFKKRLKRDHSWWKSAETWKTRLKRGGGTPWIFFTAAT